MSNYCFRLQVPSLLGAVLGVALLVNPASAQEAKSLTEAEFRAQMEFAPSLRIVYRDARCVRVSFEEFSRSMLELGSRSDLQRDPRGREITLTVEKPPRPACPRAYPGIDRMPALDARDLHGRPVSAQSLRGRPTILSFFFAACVPCIREVRPLNAFRRAHPEFNMLAVTFDAPSEARAFVNRHGVEWPVVADAQDFIYRAGINKYPTLLLFDSQGKLLGSRSGGAVDDAGIAAMEESLNQWVAGLLALP